MHASRVLEATLHLRASLDAIAAALASPDVAGLMAAESQLATAISEVGRIHLVDAADHHALRAELIRARQALQRCRVLGAVANDAARATLAAQGRSDSYGRLGTPALAPGLRGLDLNTHF